MLIQRGVNMCGIEEHAWTTTATTTAMIDGYDGLNRRRTTLPFYCGFTVDNIALVVTFA